MQGSTPKVGSPIHLAVGDFDRDNFPELAIAFIDFDTQNLTVIVWDFAVQTSLWPAPKVTTSKQSCDCFNLATQLKQSFDQSTILSLGLPAPGRNTHYTESEVSEGFEFGITSGDIAFKGLDDVRTMLERQCVCVLMKRLTPLCVQ